MNLDLVRRVLRLFGGGSAQVTNHEPEVVHRVSESFRVTDPATGRVHTYSDRNELPDSLKQALEQSGQTVGEATSKVGTQREFHIADGDGSVRVYYSLTEMPPDIRRLFD
ncbi:MAG: hypothetical protein ABFS14_10760 [Gemmatimonadota bacterium]